jgi:hypothetical protein
MASFLVTSLLAAGLLVNPSADEQYLADDYAPPQTQMVQARGGCERAIEQALAMTGGELLSVREARNGRPVCVLTVLVVNAKGRPRKVRMRMPMDF